MNGGEATEKEMVAWTTSAVAQQEQFLARLAAAGARIAPEFRYTKVVNGFSARLDPTSLALLDRDREVTASSRPHRLSGAGGASDDTVSCRRPSRTSRSPGSTARA